MCECVCVCVCVCLFVCRIVCFHCIDSLCESHVCEGEATVLRRWQSQIVSHWRVGVCACVFVAQVVCLGVQERI